MPRSGLLMERGNVHRETHTGRTREEEGGDRGRGMPRAASSAPRAGEARAGPPAQPAAGTALVTPYPELLASRPCDIHRRVLRPRFVALFAAGFPRNTASIINKR